MDKTNPTGKKKREQRLKMEKLRGAGKKRKKKRKKNRIAFDDEKSENFISHHLGSEKEKEKALDSRSSFLVFLVDTTAATTHKLASALRI